MNFPPRALFLLGALLASCTSSFWGDNSLGEHFTLLEGDARRDRAIVYCTSREYGSCVAGIPIIPSRNDLTDGKSARYVDTATSSSRWIIARAIEANNNKSYWIIDKDFAVDLTKCEQVDCDSLIHRHVLGPLELEDFLKESSKLGLPADLKL